MLNTNDLFKSVAINNKKLYELTDDDIKDIQAKLLEVLKDLETVCEKYDLRYALCGGSSLGAIRHKGYIPWDEDLDVTMPRIDYNKFPELFRKEFGDKYFVQFIYDSDKYDLSFMKIRVKNTVYEELFDPELDKAGLFIDIFPLENTYDNSFKRKLHGTIGEGLLFICSCVRIKSKQKRLMKFAEDFSSLRKVLRTKVIIGTCFSFLSLHRWLVITENWLSKCKNENSEYVTIPSGRKHFFGELYKRKNMLPFGKTYFADKEYNIMKRPDKYLKQLYGDYMTIPPLDKREKHVVVKYKQ